MARMNGVSTLVLRARTSTCTCTCKRLACVADRTPSHHNQASRSLASQFAATICEFAICKSRFVTRPLITLRLLAIVHLHPTDGRLIAITIKKGHAVCAARGRHKSQARQLHNYTQWRARLIADAIRRLQLALHHFALRIPISVRCSKLVSPFRESQAIKKRAPDKQVAI